MKRGDAGIFPLYYSLKDRQTDRVIEPEEKILSHARPFLVGDGIVGCYNDCTL